MAGNNIEQSQKHLAEQGWLLGTGAHNKPCAIAPNGAMHITFYPEAEEGNDSPKLQTSTGSFLISHKEIKKIKR